MKTKIFSIILTLLLLTDISVVGADIGYKNGKITAKDTLESSILITALYRDDILMEIKLHFGSGTIIAEPSEDFNEVKDTDTIKAFLWNIDTLTPLCSEITATYSEINQMDNKVTITINDRRFTAVLYDNTAAKMFKEILPITITMNELNGNEKYYYFENSLTTSITRPGTINEGDLMLYGENCLVLFYEAFSSPYSYTKIGYIENTNGLKNAVGNGNVIVRYE